MALAKKYLLFKKTVAIFCILIMALATANFTRAVEVGGGSSYNWSWVTGLSNNLNFGSGGLGGLVGAGFDSMGGTLTGSQLKALLSSIVQATVDPLFNDSSQDFLDGVISYLSKTDSVFANNLQTYFNSASPTFYSNLETVFANSVSTANLNTQARNALGDLNSLNDRDTITMDQQTINQLISQTTNTAVTQTNKAMVADYSAGKSLIENYDGQDQQGLLDGLAAAGFTYHNGTLYETSKLKDTNGDGQTDWSASPVATGDGGLTQDDLNDKLAWALDGCLDSFSQGWGGSSSGASSGNSSGESSGETGSGSSGGSNTNTNTNVVCISYTYSGWSTCSNGTQTRGIATKSPANCSDISSAVLSQSCTAGAVTCTSYTYGDWSACVNGTQSRAIVSRTPSGCTDTSSAVFSQTCSGIVKPKVTNTTNATTTLANPLISVITDVPATCQYNNAGGFSYGAGTAFSTTGGYNHNAELKNLANGAKTYYVVCKDNTTGGASDALKIDFTVSSAGSGQVNTNTCAALSSNDRQNDAGRSYLGNTGSDSVYLWQTVETGTRDKFTKVDWYAGYQFSPQKDGQITQVCGYFEDGVTNKVSIYSGSYKELAGVQVEGDGQWECANISPLAVKTDSRYYVIARIENDPVYFEYKSGIFPKSVNNAIIESGIRQAAGDGGFGDKIRKYDYMTFGLVDVKIYYPPKNIFGPKIISSSPAGTIEDSFATLAVQTDHDSECKFSREDVDYGEMEYMMAKESSTNFSQKLCNLKSGDFTWYVRCKNSSGAENNASAAVQFEMQ